MTRLPRLLLAAFALGLGSSITLSESALAALAALLGWRLLRDPAARRTTRWPLAAPVLALTLVTALSAALSGHPGASLWHAREVLLVAALYVTLDAVRDPRGAERFLLALAVVMAGAAALGLLQVVICPGPEAVGRTPGLLYHRCGRARGPFSIYMTLAGVLVLVLLATLPRLVPGWRRPRWLWPVWLVALAGLVATYTRGAWLGFGSGVLALVPMVRRGRLLLAGGLVVLGLSFLVAPASLRQRFVSMADPHEATIRERVLMYRSGVAIWRDHPWLGTGPGGLKRIYEDYALPEAGKRRTGHLHNTPLQVLVERGLLALGAWVWLWAAFYRDTIRLLRRLPAAAGSERALVAGALSAVTGFLASGLSEYNFGDSEVVLVAWAIMAIPYVVARGIEPASDR